MSDVTESVEATAITTFYKGAVDAQWTRFDRYARVEEYVLRKTLQANLPAPPAMVFDIGGGNGRHGFHLTGLGYRVWLCDITPELVMDAQRRNVDAAAPLERIEVADACSLGWPDESADAALLLGPMYCINDSSQRVAVLREALRVVKPGAPVFIQYISRIGALRQLLEVAPRTGGLFDWQEFMRHGVFADGDLPEFFRLHYFSTPEEALGEMREAGLQEVTIRGMDGPASIVGQRHLLDAPADIVRQWGEIAYAVGPDPEYRSTSSHLLGVARK
jgi:SAM-dependent methyltransferase